MGYTVVELLLTLSIMTLLAGMAFPMIGNTVGYLRASGDERALKNAVSLARMQAASNFARSRLYVDLGANGFHTELKTGGAWTAQVGVTYLSSNEFYSFAPVTTPPPNSQATIAQAPACLDNQATPQPIANTACIVFNSRGIPIDSTGAPTGVDALYFTDGPSVYGVTVSATSIIRAWRTTATATSSWIRQ
jgi:Tfp pilus assembly protein FimT